MRRKQRNVRAVRLETLNGVETVVLQILGFRVRAHRDPLGRIVFDPPLSTKMCSEGYAVSSRILEEARHEAFMVLTSLNHPLVQLRKKF